MLSKKRFLYVHKELKQDDLVPYITVTFRFYFVLFFLSYTIGQCVQGSARS